MRLLIAVCAAALGLLAAGNAVAARPLDTAIVDGWPSGAESSPAFQRVNDAGATTVRLTLYWHFVAPNSAPPADPADPAAYTAWGHFDEQVISARNNGLEPLVTIWGTPSWAGPTPNSTPTPTDLKGFATAAARRYNGEYDPDGLADGVYDPLPQVRFWHVWNEPNIDGFMRPQRSATGAFVSPGNYRSMVNAFSDAVKGVNAGNVVIAGSLLAFSKSGPMPLSFMRRMLCLRDNLTPIARCPASRFEIWAHHPYTSGGPNHHSWHPDGASLGDLPQMRRVLNAAIRGGKILRRPSQAVRFWVTEFSWDTNPPDPSLIRPAVHARWVAEAMYRMWLSGVSLVTWYQLTDAPINTSRYQSGLYFSLSPDKPKPALRAFRFPFVALAKNGRIAIWGRVPPPFRYGERIVVERWTGSRWARVTALGTNGHGIFRTRVRSSLTRGYFRARLANARTAPSLKFSIAPTRDVSLRYGPFGCGGPVAC